MRASLRLATAALATAGLLGGFAAPVQAANSNQRIMAAIHSVSDLLAAPAASVADANSLAQTTDAGVRRDGTLAIHTASAGDIVITLPYASQARGARVGNDGLFAGPHSSTFVRPTQGGVQVAMVAPNRGAPTNYPFKVQNGSVAAGPQGSLLLFDGQGNFNRVVPAPWARDAARKPVPTHYNVAPSGTAFTQQVAHRRSGVTYPVVADPNVQTYRTGAVITFTRFETGAIGASLIFSAIWSARLYVTGAVAAQITANVWRIQAAAAWESVHGKCLWVWVPIVGGIDTGGFNC